MTLSFFKADRPSLGDVAADVARALSYAQEYGGQQQIVTPLLYPGGGCVVLRLEHSATGFFVSDYGAARHEADLMGGQKIFARIARRQAEKHGVNFDSDLIFDIEVPAEALVAASIAVANASKAAVDATAEALSEKKADAQRERLWRLLGLAFPNRKVEHNGSYRGSTDNWTFDAIVIDEKPVLFQTVAPNPLSVHSAVTRFLDVKDGGPDETVRVSVVLDLHATPHSAVLARTSKLVEISAEASSFAKLATAA